MTTLWLNVLCGVAVVSGCGTVVFWLKATRAATPGTSWTIRSQPLYLLVDPQVWTAEGRRYWKIHFAFVVLFLACMVVAFATERFFGSGVR